MSTEIQQDWVVVNEGNSSSSKTDEAIHDDLLCIVLRSDSESDHHGIGALDISAMETRPSFSIKKVQSGKNMGKKEASVGMNKRCILPRTPKNKEEETRKKMEVSVSERHKRIAERSAALGARHPLDNGKAQHQLRKQQRLVNK